MNTANSSGRTDRALIDDSEAALTTWFREMVPLSDKFAQIDVVELIAEEALSPKDTLRTGWTLFAKLRALVRQEAPGLQCLLTIPLEFSDSLRLDSPTMEDLVTVDWTRIEVPGLYLIGDPQVLEWSNGEEYRRPISSGDSDLDAYYRCRRNCHGEYDRCVYVLAKDQSFDKQPGGQLG